MALALSAQLPIYGVRGAAAGDGFAAVTRLAVNKADLERVLDKLKSRPLKL